MVATPVPTMNVSNIANPAGLVDAAKNAVPDGILGLSLLALVMGIAFRSTEVYSFNQRLLASLGAGFMVSVLLLLAGLISVNYVMIIALLTFVAWIVTG